MTPISPTPEQAIQAFERIHRLRVTVHDLRGNLGHRLTNSRYRHTAPVCLCVKAGGVESKCVAFEMLHLRRLAHELPHGRYHVCHAGFVEWVLPVYQGLELQWMLFAGVRRPADANALPQAPREPLTRWEKNPWTATIPLPEPVDEAEATDIMEHFRQLGARLVAMAGHETAPRPGQRKSANIDRGALVRRYIQIHFGRADVRLAHLAKELGLSEDRATHAVRQACGKTFRELLLEARLETARELLRVSSLPILEIALASGFQEVAHFNRLFRRETGMTPTQYRRTSLVAP